MRGVWPIVAALAALNFAAPMANAASDDDPDFSVPTYAGAYQPQGVDEQGQWLLADESERTLRDLPVIIKDEALTLYLHSILCRAVGADRCGSARIYVVRAPIFNASMAPNGTMLVYSGLLLRTRNEAELASILAHEFAHFELRHSLQRFKRQRTTSDVLTWAAVLAGFAQTSSVSYGTNFQELVLTIHGSLAAYNRNQEREADIRGFAYTTLSHYRPSASADVWRSVMNEADATAFARGRPTQRYNGIPFLSTHPSDLERADNLSYLANRVPSAGDYDGRDQYRAAMAPWVGSFLSDQIKLNDFGGTEFVIQRLSSDGWTADLHYARGELYRLRGNPRDLVNAAQFYKDALSLDPEMADSLRGLGLSLLRSGHADEGRAALTSYLEIRPDASDASMLRSLVQY